VRIITAWQHILPEVMVVLGSAVYSVWWMGLIICWGMAVKGMGMLGVSVREMRHGM